MKKTIFTLLAALPLSALAQNNNYTIRGSISAPGTRDTVFLQYRTPAGLQQTASFSSENGNFSFTGQVTEPVRAHLTLKHAGQGETEDRLDIYLVPGTTVINAKTSLKHAEVTGTKLNEEFRLMQREQELFDKKYDALEAETNAATEKQRGTPDFKARQRAREKALDSGYQASKRAFAENHPGSIAGLLALSDFAYLADYAQVQPLFDRFNDEVKHSREGLDFAEKLAKLKATSLGATAPDFAEPDTSGKIVSLYSLRGKYVLVDFWASWCTPCRQENPNVVRAYTAYRDQGFTVLGVSLDGPKNKTKWLKAIHEDHLTWTQVSELKYMKGTAAMLYGITAIPQNILLDPDGKVVAKNVRGEDLQDKLKEIFHHPSSKKTK